MGWFRSQLQASYVSSHTEELWYNETVCLWMTIRSPMGFEHSNEEIYGCCSHNTRPFQRIEHYVTRKGIKCKKNERYNLIPYNFWADVVCLLAERYDAKTNVKLGGFRSQLRASYVSSHTEELWYNETVCLWMTIYIHIYIYIMNGIISLLCIRYIRIDSHAFKINHSTLFSKNKFYSIWYSSSENWPKNNFKNMFYI